MTVWTAALAEPRIQRNVLLVILLLVFITSLIKPSTVGYPAPPYTRPATYNVATTDHATNVPATGTDAISSHQAGSPLDDEDEKPQKVAKITKVMMLYGKMAQDERYTGALKNHMDHAELHGHAIRVLETQTMSGWWSKLTYMSRLILEELETPKEHRTQWLFWADSDTLVMNRNIPLDTFLPPEDDFSDTHALMTRDWGGLNTGLFFLRVHEWSVHYIADIMALHTYRPEVNVPADQDAQQIVSCEPAYKQNITLVPARWFNAVRPLAEFRAMPKPSSQHETREVAKRSVDYSSFEKVDKESYTANLFEPGDFVMHFSSFTRKPHMLKFVKMAEKQESEYQIPLEKLRLRDEVAEFWERARNS